MKKINKKGFTLIEMLGAVAILGIIATIGVVSVSKVIKSAHNKFDNTQYESFMQAAETYFSDNKSRLPLTPMEWKEITLQELINKKYIEKMLDSNKQEFDYARSKVVVTRLTSGKYQYEAILYRKKGSPIGKISNKVVNQNSGITFALRNKNNYYNESKTYYARDYPVIDIGISDIDELSGYQYIIYRNGKQFKKSENIELSGGGSKQDAVTLGKAFPFGKYSIKVVVYDKSGNKTTNSTDNSGNPGGGFSIYIDRTKPNCAINVNGTAGDNGWYKANRITLTLKESDKESGILKHALQTNNNFSGLVATKPLTTLTKTQDDTGGITYYAQVEDKAGNVCKTQTTVKVDTKNPSCQVLEKDGGAISSDWYNMYTAYKINPINLVTSDSGPSGVNRHILAQEKSNLSTTYKNYSNNSSLETSEGEHTYNGYVRDYAGNAATCSAFIRKDTIPPNCSTAGRGAFTLGPEAPEGYTQSVSYTITINEDNIKKVDLALTYNGSFGGETCSNYSNTFSGLYRGSAVTGYLGQCYGFRGRVLADFTYYDQADNNTKCPQEQSEELKPTPKRGCTDSSADNYRWDAEEDDDSCYWTCKEDGAHNIGTVYYRPKPNSLCYWKCTDGNADNAGEEYDYPRGCEYTEDKPPVCNDTEADNPGEEGECRYTCKDPLAINTGNPEKCKYADSTPVSCDDLDIRYTFATDQTQTSFSSTAKTVTGKSGTSIKWTFGVKLDIRVEDNVSTWEWYTNPTERKETEGSEYKYQSDNEGNQEKKFEGEGVRIGYIKLFGQDGKTNVLCKTKVYGVDKTPPKIDAMCPFTTETEGYTSKGFWCPGAGNSNIHVYSGTFVRVVDTYLPIGNDARGSNQYATNDCSNSNCNRYKLTGKPKYGSGSMLTFTTKYLTRTGDNSKRQDRYCLSAAFDDLSREAAFTVNKMDYEVCDKLGNCTGLREINVRNTGDNDWALSDGGEGNCSDVLHDRSCKLTHHDGCNAEN